MSHRLTDRPVGCSHYAESPMFVACCEPFEDSSLQLICIPETLIFMPNVWFLGPASSRSATMITCDQQSGEAALSPDCESKSHSILCENRTFRLWGERGTKILFPCGYLVIAPLIIHHQSNVQVHVCSIGWPTCLSLQKYHPVFISVTTYSLLPEDSPLYFC